MFEVCGGGWLGEKTCVDREGVGRSWIEATFSFPNTISHFPHVWCYSGLEHKQKKK